MNRPCRVTQGFTLVELLTVIAILAVFMGLAAPSFSEIALSSRLTNVTTRLVSSATLARSEAIKRNTAVILCMSADAATCATSGGWQQGWIIKTSAEVLHKDAGAATGYKINGSVSSISFDPVGVGSTPATLTVCRYSPTVGSQERVITVLATGKVQSARTATGTCS